MQLRCNMHELPREKLITLGPQVLSHSELLALILRTGRRSQSVRVLATELITRLGGVSALASVQYDELLQVPGLGMTKAASIIAACELARRIHMVPKDPRPMLLSSEDCFQQYRGLLQHRATEVCYAVALDSKNRPLRECLLSEGERMHATVSPRKVFSGALACAAASVLLLHNHPSGDPQPSEADCQVTQTITHAGLLLGVPLMDHIIIGDNSFFSFRDVGFLDSH